MPIGHLDGTVELQLTVLSFQPKKTELNVIGVKHHTSLLAVSTLYPSESGPALQDAVIAVLSLIEIEYGLL